MHETRQPGDAAVVQGEREPFVLEQESRFVNDGLGETLAHGGEVLRGLVPRRPAVGAAPLCAVLAGRGQLHARKQGVDVDEDRKSTRLNSSHSQISYAVFCLKKKNKA